jgi:hypothetical protein
MLDGYAGDLPFTPSVPHFEQPAPMSGRLDTRAPIQQTDASNQFGLLFGMKGLPFPARRRAGQAKQEDRTFRKEMP